MVSIMFTSFLFVIMFMLLHFAAYSHQAMENIVVATENGFARGGGSPLSPEKEILDVVVTAAEARKAKEGGRKMIMKRRVLEKEEEDKNGEVNSKISVATDKSVGNRNHKGKRKMSIECKLSDRSSHHHAKVKMGSFMALNADYHVPKTHPPRNN